ncbi:MAG: N-acetylmuramoyl-L-alanine amidase [Deltaproteobacteria bacterium]|nr:N-acetylmuramoyl-L-alanine amidase [Deltaproteobacteria bacterium]
MKLSNCSLAASVVVLSSSSAFASDVRLMFFRGGDAKAVVRNIDFSKGASDRERVAAILRALVAGPNSEEASSGFRSAFPAGTGVDRVEVSGNRAAITFGMDNPPPPADAARWDEIQAQVINTLSSSDPDLRDFHFNLHTRGRVVPLRDFLKIDRPAFPREGVARFIRPDSAPTGTLSGKRIAISPGHGWYFNTSLGWTTQRGDTNGLIEDFLTADICLHWLVPYLEKAGAHVIVARERDLNTREAIADNSGAGYAETGTWSDGSSAGGFKDDYRVSQTSPSGGSEAVWTIALPEPGTYRVSLWYLAGSNRVAGARFSVVHGGGEEAFTVNQRIDGATWAYLDPFFFGDTAVVKLSNLSAETGYVVADAVRFGGGKGSINRGGGVSGKPRWQEAARYFTQFAGAPASVYEGNGSGAADNSNDVVSRPLFANWAGADLFLSVHTNAFDGTATGTETFIYNGGATPGSDTLRRLVNSQIVGDIRGEWDPDWINRGEKSANFGEVREIQGMPAALTELAFHDGTDGVPDNEYLHNAKFKRLLGRAMYRAIAKYIDSGAPLITEPPEAVAIANSGPGALTVSWKAVSGAASYRVYVSADGKGFGPGIAESGTSHVLSNLAPGAAVFAKVTAVNDGGESFPSKTVAARVADARGWVPLLLVHAYDRIDSRVQIDENPGTWLVPHAAAAAAAGYFFDGATHDALGDASMLARYKAVDWIAGRESTTDETFSAAEQALVRSYLDGDGAMFVTGTEIAWDLGAKGTAADQAFLRDYLKAAYATDDAGTYSVEPVPGGIFEGVSPFSFDDGTHGTYNAPFPDTLSPQGSLPALQYAGGKGTAGVAYSGTFKLVYFGFPFETIYNDASAVEVMGRVLKFLIGDAPPEPDGGTADAADGGPTIDDGGDAGADAFLDAGSDVSFDDAQDGSYPSDASDAGPDAGRVCNEGASRCAGTDSVETCINGTWLGAAACGAGTFCSGGSCVPLPRDAGAAGEREGTPSEAPEGGEGGCGCTTIRR